MTISDDEVYQQVGRIIQQFGLMECLECAETVKNWLKRQGISGIHLKLMPLGAVRYRFIVSDRWKNGTEAISQNGVHYGVEVRGKVFDNLSSDGLTRDDWIRDFSCPAGGFIIEEIERF
jgi:hypothetical protein